MNNHIVESWKADALAAQQVRIERLSRGFAHLQLLRQERQNSSCPEISISDVVLAANITYGPEIDSATVLDFAYTAYDEGFLQETDSLGPLEFRTRLISGVLALEQQGLLKLSKDYATYTHIDYQLEQTES